MTFFPETQVYSKLPSDIKDKWKQILDLALDSTSVANNFSDTLIDSLLDSGHRTQQQLLRAGDVALFNTRIIHSGTECLRKNRKSITIYLDYDSARNKVFDALR